MNWNHVQGGWRQFRGSVQEQWGRLTDDDLDVIDGKHERLVGRLQERYGMPRDQAEREIDEWMFPLGRVS